MFIVLEFAIMYITLMTVFCALAFVFSLWPRFDKPKYRTLRGALYVILGLLGIVPFI